MKKRIGFKNTIFAFCEWDTEVMYLQCLSTSLRVWTHPHKIWEVNINNIIRQIEKIWNHLKINYKINKTDIKQYPIKIFYLVDIDTIKTKKEVDLIKKKFKQEWIEILFSNKNIELFILEHYTYYNKESKSYISEIKKYTSDYKKWESTTTKWIFKWIIENNLDILKQNIKKLKDFHESNGKSHIYDMNPYSEVINLIEYVLRFSENN